MNASLWAEIRRLYFVSRLKKKEIARELSLSVKTVRRALKEETPPVPLTRERSSQLDPFKEKIASLLKEYPTLSAVRIREEIPEYQGGMTILKDYVRTIRPRKQEAFLRIETEPGEEGQIDWGLFGDWFGCGRILSCFSFVLSYSRMMTLVWTLSQKMEDLLRSHQKSFHFFGGVMKKALYDNMRTVVLARFGKEIRFHPRFMAFAGTYLFEPVACSPGKGNQKGKVERSIGYIRRNFFEGRTFKDLADLQAQSDRWRDQVANVRIHGTTRERPLDRFEKEKPFLRPLPVSPFDCDWVETLPASKNYRISFDTNTYTVPPLYAGLPLTVRANDHEVKIFKEDRLIAIHRRSWEKYKPIEDPKHTEEVLEEKRKAEGAKAKDIFLSLGKEAEDYLKGLFQTPRSLSHELKKINALVTVYGRTEVLQAIVQAIPFNAFGSEYLKNIILQNLTKRGSLQPVGPVDPKTRPDLIDLNVEERSLDGYDQLAEKEEEKDD
jgi:transposase